MRAAANACLIVLACFARPAPAGAELTSRLQKPSSAIDVAALVNPGLPADAAAPRILACARDLLGGRPGPLGLLRVALHVAASGAVESVDVRAEAAEPGQLAPSSALVACVREGLGALRIERIPGALPTALAGTYYLRTTEGLQVHGRLREVAR